MADTNAHRLPRTRKQPQPHSDRRKHLQVNKKIKRDTLRFVREMFPMRQGLIGVRECWRGDRKP